MDRFIDSPEALAAPLPFAELESQQLAAVSEVAPWRVLIVDDEPQIHQITSLALTGFSFRDRPLQLLSAYSAAEAREILCRETGIALAIIDVVMETEHAGLELVQFIREELEDPLIRLVLRTGQAGPAPEDHVIREHEIDDYKDKTELTIQKLRTLLYSTLRAYSQLEQIQQQKAGLEKVLLASACIQNQTTLQTFASTLLGQLTVLLELDPAAIFVQLAPGKFLEQRAMTVLAVSGDFAVQGNGGRFSSLPKAVVDRCKPALIEQSSQSYSDCQVMYLKGEFGNESLLYFSYRDQPRLAPELLEIFQMNISATYQQITQQEQMRQATSELIFSMANAVESRRSLASQHTKRMGEICELLGRLYGLPEVEVNLLKHASALHDIGNIAVFDHLLIKPGQLTDDERRHMQRHVEKGISMLGQSQDPFVVMAREVVATHHEKWDGSGYPNGLYGTAIPISGRIVALADVYDALGSKRSYKLPWCEADIRRELIAQSGHHFEPKLVELMLEHWGRFSAIRQQFPDP